MDAPNRSEWVREIWSQFPPMDLTINKDGDLSFSDDNARRNYLMLVMLPNLNRREGQGNKWGFLIKNDQAGHIPADIAVWKDTLDHFDILTDKGPTWGPHGKIKDSWAFGAIVMVPGEVPDDDKEPDDDDDDEEIDVTNILLLKVVSKLDDIFEENKRQTEALNTGLKELKEQISKGIKIKF